MRLIMKRRLDGWYLYEGSSRQIGRVCPAKSGVRVLAADDARVYEIMKNGDRFLVQGSGGEAAAGTLVYKRDEKGNVIQEAYTRPPMPLRMDVHSEFGDFQLVQEPSRRVEIRYRGRQVGNLEHLLSDFKWEARCDVDVPELFLAALCILGSYLIHDDDLELV